MANLNPVEYDFEYLNSLVDTPSLSAFNIIDNDECNKRRKTNNNIDVSTITPFVTFDSFEKYVRVHWHMNDLNGPIVNSLTIYLHGNKQLMGCFNFMEKFFHKQNSLIQFYQLKNDLEFANVTTVLAFMNYMRNSNNQNCILFNSRFEYVAGDKKLDFTSPDIIETNGIRLMFRPSLTKTAGLCLYFVGDMHKQNPISCTRCNKQYLFSHRCKPLCPNCLQIPCGCLKSKFSNIRGTVQDLSGITKTNQNRNVFSKVSLTNPERQYGLIVRIVYDYECAADYREQLNVTCVCSIVTLYISTPRGLEPLEDISSSLNHELQEKFIEIAEHVGLTRIKYEEDKSTMPSIKVPSGEQYYKHDVGWSQDLVKKAEGIGGYSTAYSDTLDVRDYQHIIGYLNPRGLHPDARNLFCCLEDRDKSAILKYPVHKYVQFEMEIYRMFALDAMYSINSRVLSIMSKVDNLLNAFNIQQKQVMVFQNLSISSVKI